MRERPEQDGDEPCDVEPHVAQEQTPSQRTSARIPVMSTPSLTAAEYQLG